MTATEMRAYHEKCVEVRFWKEASRHERILEICKDARRYDAAQTARSDHGFKVWRAAILRGKDALERSLRDQHIPATLVKRATNPLMIVIKMAAEAEVRATEKAFEAYDPGPIEPQWETVRHEMVKDVEVAVLKHRGRPDETLYVDPEGEWVLEKAGRVVDSGSLDEAEEN